MLRFGVLVEWEIMNALIHWDIWSRRTHRGILLPWIELHLDRVRHLLGSEWWRVIFSDKSHLICRTDDARLLVCRRIIEPLFKACVQCVTDSFVLRLWLEMTSTTGVHISSIHKRFSCLSLYRWSIKTSKWLAQYFRASSKD